MSCIFPSCPLSNKTPGHFSQTSLTCRKISFTTHCCQVFIEFILEILVCANLVSWYILAFQDFLGLYFQSYVLQKTVPPRAATQSHMLTVYVSAKHGYVETSLYVRLYVVTTLCLFSATVRCKNHLDRVRKTHSPYPDVSPQKQLENTPSFH